MRTRVLVADDSAVARRALTRALRDAGFEVDEHASVASSRAVDPGTVACALLDLELDDGDGTEIATRLRAERPELPVAFFSSASAGDVVTRARTLGPVFAKPAELAAAVAWVRDTLVAS